MIDGKPGQILMRDDDGEWRWHYPARLPSTNAERFFAFLAGGSAVLFFALLVVLAFVLFTSRYGRAAEMPPGYTCRYIRDIAVSIGADLRWDRERTRVIAASYGVVLTEANLDALRRCFT